MKDFIRAESNQATGEIKVKINNSEKLGISNAGAIKQQISAILLEPNTHLIINMEGVRFVDSAGLSVLNYLGRIAKIRNSSITLINANQTILELISLVKENSVFEVETNSAQNLNGKVA